MPFFDVKCLKCGAEGEVWFESRDPRKIADCQCGGEAIVSWRRFSGIMSKSKGIYPRYDIQLGRTIESAQHLDRVLKAKGLMAMAPEEYERSINNHHEPEPKLDEDALKDAMEKAYADTTNGNLPQFTPQLHDEETHGVLVSADGGDNG